MVGKIFHKIIGGGRIEKEEAQLLLTADLDELTSRADSLRKHFNGNSFDLCTIINGKSGNCSEDCKFCSQSSFYKTSAENYLLRSSEELIAAARYNQERGVLRYSIVTSGRRLSKKEVGELAKTYRKISEEVNIHLCASHGLLDYEDFLLLKGSGVTRYHNNLETSRRFFPSVCTTHTYEDKIHSIRAAQQAGLEVCSGGIFGLGETEVDRIEMALELRELGIRSIPINILQPIEGTPFEGNVPMKKEAVCRMIAIYRFIHPTASIRMAGGRGSLDDNGRAAFRGGANSSITGDLLTTTGAGIDEDIQMIRELGYKIREIE